MNEIYKAPEPLVSHFISGGNIPMMVFAVTLIKDEQDVGIESAIFPGLLKNPAKFEHILCPAVSAATEILELWMVTHRLFEFIQSDQKELPFFDLIVNISMDEDGGILLLASYTSLSDCGCNFVKSLEDERARLMIQEMIGTELEKSLKSSDWVNRNTH